MRRVLVIGCNGMLGTDLMKALSADPALQTVGMDIAEVDVTKPESIASAFDRVRPEVVVNCAAMTDVDGCEAKRDVAFAVNGDAAGYLARAAERVDAHLIHISTDFVFDGTKAGPYSEQDRPNPVSVYGESKLRGEQAIQNEAARFTVLRTAWLFGKKGKNFVEIVRSLAAQRPEIRIVTDQVGSPTYTVHLSRGILAALQKTALGIYHLTNSGSCSRFEWAKKVLEVTGSATKLLPANSAEFPRPARRPANSALDCSRFERATGLRLPSWQDAVAEYFASDEEG